MGKIPKQTSFQIRHIDVPEAHGKTFNITNQQRNANRNYNEIPPHTNQNGHHQRNLQKIHSREGIEKREASCTVGRTVNRYSNCGELCVEVPLKIKHKTIT